MLVSFASAANSARKLAPNYRHWIEVEVPYIISTEERKHFLSLTTDEQRDSFITAFWRERNPDPSSESNSYKEEHYLRLAYANEHFGSPGEENGWRTEMGRMYIVLGKPKQKAVYHEKQNVRPIEIWFYEAQSPALPPFFYIMFFRHSGSEDWRVYSPTMDGPVALVTTGESNNDNSLALRFIRKSIGEEAAKVACTLIPGEQPNPDHFEPTMESDMMLATINDLPNNALTKAALEAKRLREHVTMSMLTGDSGTLSYSVVRDEQGRETLSYLLQAARPDARMVGQVANGSSNYDLTLRTAVMTGDGKSVYDKEEPLSGKLTEAQAEVARKKRFGAEERLPLAAGNYVLEVTLTNNLNHIASKTRTPVSVPMVNRGELGVSPLVAYAAPSPVTDAKGQLPFSFSHLRFTPRGAQTVDIRQGDRLPLVFQLWLGPKGDQAPEADKVHVRYVFGAVTASHDTPAEEREDIDATNRDAAGNLLTGHTLDTAALGAGSYRVVVSVTREADHRTAYGALNLRVIPSADYQDMWTAFGPADPEGDALDDLKRGMSAEAQGRDVEAQGFYAGAAAKTSSDTRPIERLAALLSRTRNGDALARLAEQPILLNRAAGPETLLPIVHALRDHGNTKGVVRLLEAQIKLQPPSAELYRTLADACDASGDSGRAHDLRALANGVK
ncbi:MAG TPA: GWxTD domain-containing protein [Terracidiphilus sp.]